MRVLIATDKFAGTLSAVEAATAIAEGWRRRSPDDVVTLAPMADGGPGFVGVLHQALGGELLAATVSGPLHDPAPMTLLRVVESVYIESAQACGLDVAPACDLLRASSRGVGEAVAHAIEAGAKRIVVGLGGSATLDGGAGLLAALGATADVPLDRGPQGLDGITRVDLGPARRALEGIDLVIASDVAIPLLGLFGAAKAFGPQNGLDDPAILTVDGILDRFVDVVCGPTPSERAIADLAGAGAAGGLGLALLLLGGRVHSGIDLVAQSVDLAIQCDAHDLVVTGEGAYDFSSRSGKVVFGVAQTAAATARPCIVMAGEVSVGSREMRAMGVESAYSLAELVGSDEALGNARASLVALAERVARTWSF